MVFEYCDQVRLPPSLSLSCYLNSLSQDLKKYFDSLASVISQKTVQVYKLSTFVTPLTICLLPSHFITSCCEALPTATGTTSSTGT